MTRADFSIRECGAFVFDSYTDLVAPVKHGRIAWQVHYQDNGSSPLATENIYTSFTGRITGNTATLTLRDKRVDPSSTCTGVHTYHLRRTTPPSGGRE